MKKVVYYNSFNEDIVESKKQDFKLKDNYKYIHTNIFYRFFAVIIKFLFLIVFYLYLKIRYNIKFKNKKLLKKHKGYFLFMNHTNMLGDPSIPYILSCPNFPYFIVNTANLGIPILGKLLPMLGALPIKEDIKGLNELQKVITYYINNGKNIVIFPEAHLFPYYTDIRPLTKSAFHFPVNNNSKVFTATVTYQKRKIFKVPKIVVYIDGPFTLNDKLSKKENITYLHDKVYESLKNNSRHSNIEYIKYIKK